MSSSSSFLDRFAEALGTAHAIPRRPPKPNFNPNKKTPLPEPVLKDKAKERKHMSALRELEEKKVAEMRSKSRPLDRWLKLLANEKDAEVVRHGCVDWDVVGAAEDAGLLGESHEVRRQALQSFMAYMRTLQRKHYGPKRVDLWFGDPLPKALGGHRSDIDRVKSALYLS